MYLELPAMLCAGILVELCYTLNTSPVGASYVPPPTLPPPPTHPHPQHFVLVVSVGVCVRGEVRESCRHPLPLNPRVSDRKGW